MVFKSFLATLLYPLLFTTGVASTLIHVKFLPDGIMVELMGLAIFLDLITGLLKSWKKGVVTSSQGFKATSIKILAYCSCVLAVWLLLMVIANTGIVFWVAPEKVMKGIIGFLTFVEIYSVFENIDEAYPDAIFSKFVIRPILKLLKGKLANNPLLENSDNPPS